MFDEVTPKRLRKVIRRLLAMAEAGDVAAIKVLHDRVFGRTPYDVLEFIAQTEDYTATADPKFM